MRASIRSRTKKRTAPDDESVLYVPAPEALIAAVLYNKDILVGCISPFLSQRDFVHLLMCSKKLYAFSSSLMIMLRECCRRYGNDYAETSKWIKRCIKRNHLEAVTWVLERALRDYQRLPDNYKYFDKRIHPLLVCSDAGLKAAFKHGRQDIAMYLTHWHRTLTIREKRSLFELLPSALYKGTDNGHSAVVRHFLVTELQSDVDIPNDGYIGYLGDPSERARLLSKQFLIGCVCNGDAENYGFFEELFLRHHPEIKGKSWLASEMYARLLERGRDITFVPVFKKQVADISNMTLRDTFYRAFQNPHPIMLEYLLSTTPRKELLECKDAFIHEYETCEMFVKRIGADLTLDPTVKKSAKLLVRLQKRLAFLKGVLTHTPFNVEWRTFRPHVTSTFRQGQWQYKGPY